MNGFLATLTVGVGVGVGAAAAVGEGGGGVFGMNTDGMPGARRKPGGGSPGGAAD